MTGESVPSSNAVVDLVVHGGHDGDAPLYVADAAHVRGAGTASQGRVPAPGAHDLGDKPVLATPRKPLEQVIIE